MNQTIASELEILWSDVENADVAVILEAFARLKAAATKDDLPQLVAALNATRSDFWIRELLAEPIAELGGCDYLPDLLAARQKSATEGHDNDSLNLFLIEIAMLEPEACRARLIKLLESSTFVYKEAAEWLLAHCESRWE